MHKLPPHSVLIVTEVCRFQYRVGTSKDPHKYLFRCHDDSVYVTNIELGDIFHEMKWNTTQMPFTAHFGEYHYVTREGRKNISIKQITWLPICMFRENMIFQHNDPPDMGRNWGATGPMFGGWSFNIREEVLNVCVKIIEYIPPDQCHLNQMSINQIILTHPFISHWYFKTTHAEYQGCNTRHWDESCRVTNKSMLRSSA